VAEAIDKADMSTSPVAAVIVKGSVEVLGKANEEVAARVSREEPSYAE